MNRERERIRREIFDKSKEVVREQPDIYTEGNSEINPKLLQMFPPERIKRIMEKEARKYKAALEKKWSKWFESVSK